MKNITKHIALNAGKLLKVILLVTIFTITIGISGYAQNSRQNAKFTVVIDPGHGGKDHGATDNNVREKDINLAVARKLEDLIKKKLKNVNVIMTRDDDEFISLQKRADIANNNHADLFISIHTNSLEKTNAKRATTSGTSVYVLGTDRNEENLKVAQRENSVIEYESDKNTSYSNFDPSKDESIISFGLMQTGLNKESNSFAYLAQQELVNVAQRVNRGVKQAGFYVLRATSTPSVLVELDFICNPTEAAFLSSNSGQEKLATALFNALSTYIQTRNITGQSVGKNNDSGSAASSSNKPGAKTNSGSIQNAGVTKKQEEKKRKEEEKRLKEEEKKRKEAEKKNKKGNLANSSAKNANQTADNNVDTSGEETGILTSGSSSSKRKHLVSTNLQNKKGAPRRRRSAMAKKESDKRNLQTASIDIIEESSYMIKVESSTQNTQPQQQPVVADNKKNNKSKGKNDKQAKKQNNNKDNKATNNSQNKNNKTLTFSVANSGTSKDANSSSAQNKTGSSVDMSKPKTSTIETLYTVQILKTDKKYDANDPVFKGYSPINWYEENGKYIYTYGESKDNKEIYKIFLEIAHEFPGAYVVTKK